MFSPSNVLGLPQIEYGLVGIQMVDNLSETLAKSGFTTAYDPHAKKISILKTSDIPPSFVERLLSQDLRLSLQYRDTLIYPKIQKGDPQGDLEIKICDTATHYIEGSEQEIEKLENELSQGVIRAMEQFFNRHDKGRGIWYPDDYASHLKDEEGKEMDPSFFSGFADEAFFEKADSFTFHLKEGKKASDALLSFLQGPTIADCGNAIQACYYKCILDVISKERFDLLFSDHPCSARFLISQQISAIHPLKSLVCPAIDSLENPMGVLGQRPLQIGDVGYFGGVKWYHNKHLKGFAGGWNTIYIGDDKEQNQLFIAHGFAKPQTEKEIQQQFLALYNQERTPQEKARIAEAKNPQLHDPKVNFYLKFHETIPLEIVEIRPEAFLKGFIPEDCVKIDAKKLLAAKRSASLHPLTTHLESVLTESFMQQTTLLTKESAPLEPTVEFAAKSLLKMLGDVKRLLLKNPFPKKSDF
ncbi:MAG: hypothetical protein K0S07_667 [Chlamydiales bacterium]|jgi:hypothetical protein|nr:hypothetical protein [Chlamydiales bacterium]